MKKSLLLILVVLCASFVPPKKALHRDDKTLLLTLLTDTKANLLKEVQGLSDEQLKFKPAPDRWSVIEVVEHINRAETGMFAGEQAMMKEPADSSKRAMIKVTDQMIVSGVEDRSKKFKAPEQFVPKDDQSPQQTIQNFITKRDEVIAYVTNTNDDMRNHVTDKTPMGPIDAYQLLLLDAAHTNRHTQQIVEVKNSPNFPK
ncbi:MAG: DinB family protein [Chitinophaga sp.]|uniref:DinB family protein n=1 Tax=Chitinophaga sp. TaxID=1869181 RepID=UPI0025BB36FC|nr:DinB family protein [Chitinophaga sp.]MBV8255453.1 DinB family protein [Chitinophaga sp.]